MNTQSDLELMKLVSVGDQQAFASLSVKHAPSLLHFCYATVNDEELAKDILQNVLIVWWQKASLWDKSKGALSTWLHRIAYNQCIDALRKLKNKPTCELDDEHHVSDEDTIEDKLLYSEKSLKIGKAILNLPDKQRTAMLLTYYEDFTNADVAERMGLKVKAVESLLVRARKKLKGTLGGLNS